MYKRSHNDIKYTHYKIEQGKQVPPEMIQELVTDRLHIRARENSRVLRMANTGTVTSQGEKEPVMLFHADKVGNIFHGSEGSFNKFTYDTGVISNEIWNESQVPLQSTIEDDITLKEAADKAAFLISTILGPLHFDPEVDTGESWKPEETRDPAYFKAVKTPINSDLDSQGDDLPIDPSESPETAAALIDSLLDMQAEVNSNYSDNAVYLISQNTMNMIKKLRDADGFLPLKSTPIEFNGEILSYYDVLDKAIVVIDGIPDYSLTGAVPWVLYGDMNAAVTVNELEGSENMVADNVSVKGATSIYYETKYSVHSLSNNSLVIGWSGPDVTPVP
ncbi:MULTISPECIES: phage major capsid protein [Vibrio]|uniref:phage major capsid protein n=1 Tax=Vibrio TaxID=662 RepID=UPI0020750254|nr:MULTISPECIES: phage major capsid protein [Vibrio]USD32044.1 phage major capsid protein [Vibrio sp. SCSIO 43186]USD45085.1 phage major capsid protein [Vibrio sp. SCSIO 43145]USD69167.1 phage major capsid protein [Vibrio sp. SCSIO 43139]USD96857.1 phage major capsid protein [Vibrio coralliilyticus]